MSEAHHLSTSETLGYIFLCVGLVCMSGLMSGLTLGLLSLDHVELEVRPLPAAPNRRPKSLRRLAALAQRRRRAMGRELR